MKKLLMILFLIVTVTSLIFAGIGCKEETVETTAAAETTAAETTAAETTAAETTAADLEPVTLRWAFCPFNDFETEVIEKLVAQYTAEHPNVTVELEPIVYTEYLTKLATYLSVKDLPDILWTHTGWTSTFAADGIALDLGPYLASGDYPVTLDDFPENMQSVMTALTGEVTIIPRSADIYTVFYNKTLFDEAGVEYPTDDWTWDDWKEKAMALTMDKGDYKQYGFQLSPSSDQEQLMAAAAEGFDISNLSADGTEYNFNSPEAVKGISYMWEGIKEGYVAPPELFNETGGSMWYTGQAAMVFMARWGVPPTRDQAEFDWDVVVTPKGESGIHAAGGGAAGYCVSSTTQNPDVAVDLLLSMLSEEGMLLFTENYSAVPPIKTLFDSEIWKGLDPPPYNNDAFVKAFDGLFVTPKEPWYKSEHLVPALEDARTRYLEGMDIQQALDQAVAEFNAKLVELKADYE